MLPVTVSPFSQSEIGFGKLETYVKLDKLGEVRGGPWGVAGVSLSPPLPVSPVSPMSPPPQCPHFPWYWMSPQCPQVS